MSKINNPKAGMTNKELSLLLQQEQLKQIQLLKHIEGVRGILTFNNTQSFTSLSASEVIEQLNNINNVQFKGGDYYGMNYFDRVLETLKQNSPLNSAIYGQLQNLFKDPNNIEKLKSLGATDTDFALINNNRDLIQQSVNTSKELNIYEFATKFRFLDTALKMYIKEYKDLPFLNSNTFSGENIIAKVGQQEFPLKKFADQEFSINNNRIDESANTLAIYINDIGNVAWNSKVSAKEYPNIISYFDKVIAYGNSDTPISLVNVQNIIAKAEHLHHNLKFAFINIHQHGLPNDPKLAQILNIFPEQLANTTVCFLESCFSGQYHQNWNKKAILITAASSDEPSSVEDNLWLNKQFVEKLKATNNPVDTILEYATKFTKSTPHVSGEINGKIFHNESVIDVYNQLHPELLEETPTTFLGNILNHVHDYCSIM